jgi:signal transduction histidine kinase/ABC-type uncharacterized transport system substrate-binding protein
MARFPFRHFFKLYFSVKQLTYGITLCFTLVAIIIISTDTFASQDVTKKRVLILHSYYQGYKWTDDEHAGIESVLKPVIGRNNIHIEYMDTKKVFGDLYSQRLYEVYKLKYNNYKFDLIITTDNNAFEFMLKYRDELFPRTPVVFCGVNYFREDQIKGHEHFTGVNEENDFTSYIKLILQLHPKTKQIVFINEWTTTGQGVHKAFLDATVSFQQSIQFLLLEDVYIDEILNQLQLLTPESIVLYTAFSKDKSGRIFEYADVAALIARNCPVPIYTTNDFNLGHGVLGGFTVNGYDQGETAGKIALRILQGERAEDIPVLMETPKRYLFDYNQMQKFRFSPDRLPQNSVIINLPETLYFKYKKWIGAVAAVFVALLLIISILLINIKKRKRTEMELKGSQEQLRALGLRLAETEETQRKALSRELHDQIGQNLTILGVNLNILRSLVPKNVTDIIHSRISDSLLLVKQTTERVRSLMNNLRSPVLDDYGLVAAIDLYGKQFSSRTGIDAIVRVSDATPQFPTNIENAVFRIMQESLTNVVKHAQATQVVININVSADRLLLSIEDNGIGYDMSKITNGNKEQGWGLITMKERALAVGGSCRIQSRLGMGTHIIVEVPI